MPERGPRGNPPLIFLKVSVPERRVRVEDHPFSTGLKRRTGAVREEYKG
jgi:hypothetical protein